MNIKKTLFLLLFASLAISCGGKKTLLDEERTFPNTVWNRFTPQVYTVDVQQPDTYYNIDLEVVVDTARMRGTQLPLTVNLYSPDNERRMFYSGIEFIQNGRWKGEAADNPGQRVLHQTIRSFFSFNRKGEHRLEIGQATSQYDLDGVHSLKVTISKAELDYKDL